MVLLVEDDQKIAAAVKRGLEAEGFTVEVAVDGNDGLWLATKSTYDLIVLDIMRPAATATGSAPTCERRATGPRS